jgi:hypothetical protein
MRRPVNRQPVLKAQDFYLLLALLARGDDALTYPELAAFTGLSMSEVHGALKRVEQARLLAFNDRRPALILPAFREFLVHAHAAAPLNALVAPSADPPPVWPHAQGSVRGLALVPLYPSAPAAALKSPALYENLALFDALRIGNARERGLAVKLFEERL